MLTTCSSFPTPMINTLLPNGMDCKGFAQASLRRRASCTDIDSSVDATLHTGALNRKLERDLGSGLDPSGRFLWSRPTFDKHGAHARHQLLRKIEATLDKICYNDGFCTRCTRREKGNESNGSCATASIYERAIRISKRDTCQIRVGSPRRRPQRSIPARATANGSQRAPSSNDTESGRRCSHSAGCRCHLVKVPAR